jgi:hypothetical protein
MTRRRAWLAALATALALLLLLDLLLPPSFDPAPPPYLGDSIAEQARRGLAVLADSERGAFDPARRKWLDLPGFRADDDEAGAWAAMMSAARELAEGQMRDARGGREGTALGNVTGYVRGRWTAVGADGGAGREGVVHVSIVEKGPADEWAGISVRGVSASVTLGEEGSQASMYGLHVVETGSVVLVTSSRK